MSCSRQASMSTSPASVIQASCISATTEWSGRRSMSERVIGRMDGPLRRTLVARQVSWSIRSSIERFSRSPAAPTSVRVASAASSARLEPGGRRCDGGHGSGTRHEGGCCGCCQKSAVDGNHDAQSRKASGRRLECPLREREHPGCVCVMNCSILNCHCLPSEFCPVRRPFWVYRPVRSLSARDVSIVRVSSPLPVRSSPLEPGDIPRHAFALAIRSLVSALRQVPKPQ